MFPEKQQLPLRTLGTKCALYHCLTVSVPENVTCGPFWPFSWSLAEEVADGLFHDIAADLGNRLSQGNVLGADLDAVLGVATFLDASVAHQRGQAFSFQSCTGGVGIEK